MEALKLAGLILLIGIFAAGVGGFCLLKSYDEFQKATQTKSRIRLWLAFSYAMFTILAAIIGFSGIGSSIEKNRNAAIKLPNQT